MEGIEKRHARKHIERMSEWNYMMPAVHLHHLWFGAMKISSTWFLLYNKHDMYDLKHLQQIGIMNFSWATSWHVAEWMKYQHLGNHLRLCPQGTDVPWGRRQNIGVFLIQPSDTASSLRRIHNKHDRFNFGWCGFRDIWQLWRFIFTFSYSRKEDRFQTCSKHFPNLICSC